jgi:hypothetical protein
MLVRDLLEKGVSYMMRERKYLPFLYPKYTYVYRLNPANVLIQNHTNENKEEKQ